MADIKKIKTFKDYFDVPDEHITIAVFGMSDTEGLKKFVSMLHPNFYWGIVSDAGFNAVILCYELSASFYISRF